MRHGTPSSAPRRVALAALLLVPFSIPAMAARDVRVAASDVGLERAARGLERGGRLVVDGYLLEGDTATSTLELERFDVWRADAQVYVDGRQVAAPKTAYFRGSVAGYPGSSALLAVRENGGTMGMVFRGDEAWAIGKGRGQGALRSKKARPEEYRKKFECGLDELVGGPGRLGVEEASAPASASTIFDQPYVATIAVETDYEYYALFGNQQDALDYMGDLFGYADLVYSREIDTDMTIGYARIWTTNSDPYPTTTNSSTALTNFRNHWNANMQSVDRTVAHMLSGMSTGGGVAWVGVLCDAYQSPGNNYSYGYSGTLDGNFNWDGNQGHNPSSVVWDIMVVQHEIGHNFNSPHTQDYCNIGGSSQPIDRCYQGCAGAAQGLPSCSSPTPFFNGGAGTIMSYCHLQSGSYNNQAMTFGEGHTCGVLPGREADRMSAHVVARSSVAGCFAPQTCGNGQLDAGEECDGGNLGGATCSSEGFFGGTLSCNSNCTLNTSQCTNCGNNVINAGEVCDGTALGGATCTSQGCGGGALGCNATCSGYDKSLCTGCPPCNNNGTCDLGEDCNGCASDCPGGTTSGAVCGNGICEAGNGEDCASCPSDCNGVQGGKPSGRYCCGDGGGSNPIPCTDSRCTAGGKSCTTVPSSPGSYCCGDSTCSNGESCATCAVDCSLFNFEVCDNGVDDDCNGQVDCNDSGCSAAPECQVTCTPSGQACSASSECCSNNCRTRGKNAGTCA
jgi:hypothetical protein